MYKKGAPFKYRAPFLFKQFLYSLLIYKNTFYDHPFEILAATCRCNTRIAHTQHYLL
jgi:hypothetical protein